jgi:uncharacterized protein (DUF362 family)
MKKLGSFDRRTFFKWLLLIGGALLLSPLTRMANSMNKMKKKKEEKHLTSSKMPEHKKFHIYISKNGSPEQNVAKVIEMMGGIEKIIGQNDIVIIKPNAQWETHGMTNTNTIKGFIDLVLKIPHFAGEVIIAENHHARIDNSRAWTTQKRNGDYNLNELVAYYNERGVANVTKYHWRDGGPNPKPLQWPAGDGGIVTGPEQGDGYVWTDEEYVYLGRKTKMTYPIFTSSYSGTTIDFKNGAWKQGHYTGQPVKFINVSTLNHHSSSFGVTACIKNYLGVVDLTCGLHGPTPEGYYNFHYISTLWPKTSFISDCVESSISSGPIRNSRFLSKVCRRLSPKTGALGGAVGHFMNTIRKADLDIIAAEYVGHEGRWEPPAHTKAVLASNDPVALDYYAGKYVLLPLGGNKAKYNDPDDKGGPFRKCLERCHAEGVGTLDEKNMAIHQYDHKGT